MKNCTFYSMKSEEKARKLAPIDGPLHKFKPSYTYVTVCIIGSSIYRERLP